MFIHPNKLLHVLTPDEYRSEQQHRLELDRVLLPGWHPVAAASEFRRDGDFQTLTLFDKPLLLRRIDGEVHAYLNVCGHRHCLLTSKPAGHDPNFRCQYHGWEYQCDGRTGKIPEAQSFRPFDRENARLLKYRTARLGDLVFVNLSDSEASLDDHLGPNAAELTRSYSEPFRLSWKWQADYPANWKLPIENGVESYHIPCLHQKTFKNFPEEANVTHELHPTWTSYRTEVNDPMMRFALSWTTWWLGLPFTNAYTHLHVFPNLTFVTMDNLRMLQAFVPLSPTTSRSYVWLYAPAGPNRGFIPWLYVKGNAWAAKAITKMVLAEDGPIFADVQRGLNASPIRGVIGRREERVFMFQDYIARRCQGTPAEPRDAVAHATADPGSS